MFISTCEPMSRCKYMSYLYDLLFFFTFIIINHIISLKQTNRHTCFFAHFLEYALLFLDDNVDEESKYFLNSKSSASGCCLSFAQFFCQFQPGVAYKSAAYTKKSVCSILENLETRKIMVR